MMNLCVLGLGKMGSSFVQGLLEANVLSAENIVACDPLVEVKEKNSVYGGIKTFQDNLLGVKKADIILLAVKPQLIEEVLEEIKQASTGKLIISIAAGVKIKKIQEKLASTRIIRVMPNTPSLVKAGMSAIAAGSGVKEEELLLVEKMFKGLGKTIIVEEKYLDAITGLSGSGPAYIYLIIEALADGGVLMGLPREMALKLAAQTVLGSAKMVLETGKHPGELKDMVTSPAGTTITGLETLEKHGLRGILIDAVKNSTLKAKDLG